MTNSNCNCTLHQQIKRWKDALNPQTPEAEAAFNEMLDAWENAETDVHYYRAILDGSWPTAVEQLTAALEGAKKVRRMVGINQLLEKLQESPMQFLSRISVHLEQDMPRIPTADYRLLLMMAGDNDAATITLAFPTVVNYKSNVKALIDSARDSFDDTM